MKSTFLIIVGLIGSMWGFFAPLGLMNASTLEVVLYGIAFASFMVMFVVGLYIKSNNSSSKRNKDNT